MNLRLLYIAFLTLVASCATVSTTTTEAAPSEAGASYERLIRAARAHAEAGRVEQATKLAERGVQEQPDKPDAYAILGLTLAQLGKLDEAAAQYELARSHGGKDRRIFVELASVYDVAQKWNEAVGVYLDYLKDHPDDAEMRQELGLTYLLLQKDQEAAHELQIVARAHPENAQVQQDWAYALLRTGEPKTAAEILEKLIAQDPNRTEAIILLARARAAEGKPADAIAHLDRVIAANPSEQRALRMRARLYQVTGNLEKAAGDYEKLIAAGAAGDNAVLLGYAGALIALGRLDDAQAALGKVREKLKGHPLLAFREAQLAWRRGNKAALKTIAEFARNNPTDVEAWRETLAAAKKLHDKKLIKDAQTKLRSLGDLP